MVEQFNVSRMTVISRHNLSKCIIAGVICVPATCGNVRFFLVGLATLSLSISCIRFRPLISDDKTPLETVIIGQYAETGFDPLPNFRNAIDSPAPISRLLILLEQHRAQVIEIKERGMATESNSGLLQPTNKLLSRENDAAEQQIISHENLLREQLGEAIENHHANSTRMMNGQRFESHDYIKQYSTYRRTHDDKQSLD